MSKIILDADTSDCPGCICKVLSSKGHSFLVQQDHQAPGVASSFGWNLHSVQKDGIQCRHDSDGSVDCKSCGVTAGEFIQAATEWIEENDGIEIEDPGYFWEEEDDQ